MVAIYEVGGAVRDKILGIQSKDIDYVSVLDKPELYNIDDAYAIMKDWLLTNGYSIFLETPKCLTIRTKSPIGEVSDFVLARKETGYKKGTREPIVVPGTLYDDLLRRDFTINAIAKDKHGNYIDYFYGLDDLKNEILRTPLNPMDTLTDDPLRAVRAVRFKVILGFEYELGLKLALLNEDLIKLMDVVSDDRIREELHKCFKHNTFKTLCILNELPTDLIQNWLTRENLWLMPTTKK